MKRNSKSIKLILLAIDFIVLSLVFGLSYLIRVKYDPRPLLYPVYAKEFLFSSLVVIPLWILGFLNLGLYSTRIYRQRIASWARIIIGNCLGILLIIGWEYITGQYIFPARLVTLYVLFGSITALIFARELFNFIQGYLFAKNIGTEKVLLIGKNEIADSLLNQLAYNPRSGYDLVASTGIKLDGIKYYPRLETALNNLDNDQIMTIIQTDMYDSASRNHKILHLTQVKHLNYMFIPGEPEFYYGKNTIEILMGYPILSVHQTPLIGWGEIIKRFFDLVITILFLPIWGTIFLLICLLQKIFNPGPIFYTSKRLSRFSQPFDLYKFRSMGAQYGSKDAALEFEEMGRPDLAEEYRLKRKVDHDPRITKFGQFLRTTSLDELPQLINVLKGNLSLVGPRPILPQELKFSDRTTALLHSVKSGVTGLWQVSGRSNLSFEKRIELETYYTQNWSLWLDLKILIKTPLEILKRRGSK